MEHSWWTYLDMEGAKLFTMVLLPRKTGKFPVVIMRLPCVDYHENTWRSDYRPGEKCMVLSSDCEDACFLVRVSIETEMGNFGLRDDITTLCYALGDYTPGSKVQLQFQFDDRAFLSCKGQRLRIDITSADKNHYLRHTNCKGLAWEQTAVKTACNTVYLAESALTLPVV